MSITSLLLSLFTCQLFDLFIFLYFLLSIQTIFQSMDHHWKDDIFATSGQQVDVWDEERAEPIRTFTWGVDSISHIKFNPIEVGVQEHVQCSLYFTTLYFSTTWIVRP